MPWLRAVVSGARILRAWRSGTRCALAFAGVALGAAAQEPGAPSRLALLVAIDDYSPAAGERRPTTLRGAKNDIARAKQLLVSRFGFDERDIVTLVDQQATHAAVVRAFHEQLIARAGPETEALFWYSGHGSLCPDAAEREQGGLDNTLVCWDSRIAGAAPGYDLTDDELYSLRRALAAKTSRITFVLDSCHSGGATRGGDGGGEPPLVRFAPAFDRPLAAADVASFWPPGVEFLDDDDPRRTQPVPHVAIAACAHGEPAHEHRIALADGTVRSHGALTWFLCDALEQAQPGETWLAVARRAAVQLAGAYPRQQVQLEGDLTRELFSARFGPAPRGVAAETAAGSRLVQLFAGTLQGLRVGSQVEIVEEGGGALGLAEVKQARPISAVAELAAGVEPPAARRPVRAIEIARPEGAPPLIVFVARGSEAHDALAARLAALERPRVEVVRDDATDAALAVAPRAGGRCGVLVLPERLETEVEDFDALAHFAAEELRHRQLMALPATPGSIAIAVALVPGEDADRPRSSVVADGASVVLAVPPEVSLDQPAPVQLLVTLDAKTRKRPAYVTVLCVSEDRTFAPLWPLPGATDNQALPGVPYVVDFDVFPTPIAGLDRPPLDRILVLATDHPADFAPYRSGGVEFIAASADPETFRAAGPRLPSLVQDALAPCRPVATRGARRLATVEETFGIAAIDLRVVVRRQR